MNLEGTEVTRVGGERKLRKDVRSGATPRRAVFFWEGQSMSWLRWMAPISFAFRNPRWGVVVHTPADPWDAGIETLPKNLVLADLYVPPYMGSTWAKLHPRVRADMFRWWEMYLRGGLFLNTDIITVRSFEGLVRWLDRKRFTGAVIQDSGVQLPGSKIKFSTDLVSSHRGNPFYSNLYREASQKISEGDEWVAGAQALVRGWEDLWISLIGNIPTRVIHPWRGRSNQADASWAAQCGLTFPPKLLGLHWFGELVGDKENWITSKTWQHMKCPIVSALKMAFR